MQEPNDNQNPNNVHANSYQVQQEVSDEKNSALSFEHTGCESP